MTRKTTAKRMGVRAFLAHGGVIVLYCAFVALFSFSGKAAQAQSQDPLTLGAKWFDLDSFEENQKKEEEEAAHPVIEETKLPQLAFSAVPAKAEPVRPLNLPSLPTMTSDHGLFVESTEEDRARFWNAAQEHDWKSIETAEEETIVAASVEQLINILGRDPFKVRYASLPNLSIQSIMASRVSTSVLDREAKSRKAEKAITAAPVMAQKKIDPAVQKETNQACEAFADYRRRQLAAMESDRKTLSALQSALAEMGLSKDLNFMTKKSGVLASQVQEATTQKSETLATPIP